MKHPAVADVCVIGVVLEVGRGRCPMGFVTLCQGYLPGREDTAEEINAFANGTIHYLLIHLADSLRCVDVF